MATSLDLQYFDRFESDVAVCAFFFYSILPSTVDTFFPEPQSARDQILVHSSG
jgi:hypothetical protein